MDTEQLNQIFFDLSPFDLVGSLQKLCELMPNQKKSFSTSLSLEDQIITHVIFTQQLPIEVFTLETGRLFPETLQLIDITESRYGQKINRYYPNKNAVEAYIHQHGLNGFYDSVENRKRCCHIRKVSPLNHALQGVDIWLTGLRHEQSTFRENLPLFENDDEHQLVKFNPLLDWTLNQVKTFIDQHQIPYNPLHNLGYPSIGCEPCTRAIKPGENVRAGRWWWENEEVWNQECGLHVHK
ncbi:MAG: phosphoadenylyl-sulfate reductase [Hydrogenovibrio sp.]|uniref:phosphoadenylyl-sulfate reductase n=1 Tax=Hydrogenovibrio sp. TaxID=2065821 RepID=UPI00286FCC90|nr:phosphoadenylyl-sulfate reductase [Hydrogenovibrio sp.]MDR9499751.1 phosphoadenylyl-sulfate reductase [Hydrogenovibrio sp.]